MVAPYGVSRTKGRKHKEEEDPIRSPWQRDRDRIIHSVAFRRLEYKTQVFVNHEGDHYRTRLTHTLEVAQISRTIARALQLNEDLTEAIALAHDIGHPPFGHAGEEALKENLPIGFEHNRQGLRVVDVLERRYANFPANTPPTLEAQIINVADVIAYNSHDLDDGLRADYISLDHLQELPLWADIFNKVYEEYKDQPIRVIIYETLRRLIAKQVRDVTEYTRYNVEKHKIKTVDDVRNIGKVLVEFSPDMREQQDMLRRFLEDNLYRHYKVVKMQEKAKRYIKAILEIYLKEPAHLPPEYQERITDEYSLYQTVCDYIAGMTDRFAQEEYARLFMPFTKM
ncbi:deoxyguanosinetriphosphate triphosphohydrolase [candidate division bacterium WOR-3 4484_18]|uniref:Deoxyguanosinetriphosphate triphosphohydrolase-like protein n=1 Tax=candidate division WOR-3 bacterium 4484_18 TaxID=2020626 RepID=A0A257LTA7_UNCW3|nr:MAG: deoxyguanosinetriphosphate triphosphohydrolase [candidate division bacterium WOR-3 4484_18]